MMLKKAVNPKTEDRFLELMSKCTDIDQKIFQLQQEKIEVQKEMLEIQIAPFKIGDYALAEVQIGRSKKWQKCLLECGNGILYLRPVTKDGELSGRHFSCTPVLKSYSEVLKKVVD